MEKEGDGLGRGAAEDKPNFVFVFLWKVSTRFRTSAWAITSLVNVQLQHGPGPRRPAALRAQARTRGGNSYDLRIGWWETKSRNPEVPRVGANRSRIRPEFGVRDYTGF